MKSKRAYYFFYHVLSQLTRKSQYLHMNLEKKKAHHRIEKWGPKDWDEFIKDTLPKEQVPKGLRGGFGWFLYETIQVSLDLEADLITFDSPDYPEALKAIPDHPLCLFCQGEKKLLQRNLLGMIGSRRASSEALDQSLSIAHALVNEGYTIVSGGAYGCDVMAHQGALEAKSNKDSTIAVFAGGLCQLYPKGNFAVFDRIKKEGGLLLSERLWDQSSLPFDFPIRNRIISGLCKNLLVMDAALKSGSMVTAHSALDQGRNVYVLKPPFSQEQSPGIEKLIEDGAQMFHHKKDVKRLLHS